MSRARLCVRRRICRSAERAKRQCDKYSGLECAYRASRVESKSLSEKLLLGVGGTFRPPRIFLLAGVLAAGCPLGVASTPAKKSYLEGLRPPNHPFQTVSKVFPGGSTCRNYTFFNYLDNST